ncbi:MAG: DUF692 family protein [Deltaproteobacteria bacterium]|nr:DUF692 family protein [Deltaproteobacteria bacterium]
MTLPPPNTAPTGVGLGLRWAFIDEVAAGEAPASIRFFEVSPENYMRRGGSIPGALETVTARYPVITHGLMMNVGGTTELDPAYLEQLRHFLGRMGARYHSDHLCWSGADGAILHDLLPLPHDPQTVQRCVDQIARIEDALGLPFAVENISYYLVPGGGMPEAAVISEILDRADCGLLLDVNNVAVNAENHGFDPIGFMEALPLSRVVQLHVAGGERRPHLDDLIIDSHGTDVCAHVQSLMAWVVERIGPVPVIYERDHDIPSLAELGRQVAQLQQVYDEALGRYDATAALVAPTPPPASQGAPIASLAGIQRGLSSVIVDRDGGEGLLADPQGWLAAHGVDSPDDLALADIGARRLRVYRSLVRGGLRGVVEAFLPRTIARLGADGFDAAFCAWLHASPPRSRYFRDVPGELVEWATEAWPADPHVHDMLVDLARLEILESEIDAAPQPPIPEGMVESLVLDRPLVFSGVPRLARFAYAIHTLPTDEADTTVPACEPTVLLLYRDDAHEVRTLALSTLAAEVLRRLIDDGQTVSDAIRGAAGTHDGPVDDEVLGRLSALLADLAQRGVIVGAHPG